MTSYNKRVDYYDILGVSRSVDSASLKAAYRRLALAKHPDKNPDSLNATEDFQKIGSAYTTLADPELRRTYDRQNPPVDKTRIKINVKRSNPQNNGPSNSPRGPSKGNPEAEPQVKGPIYFPFPCPMKIKLVCNKGWIPMKGRYTCRRCERITKSRAAQCPGCRHFYCTSCKNKLGGKYRGE